MSTDYDLDEQGEVIPEPKKERAVVDNDAWVLQVSLKTPRGALINIRGTDAWGLQAHMESIKGLVPMILELEAELTGQQQQVPQALQALGAQPIQQQQAPAFVQQPPPQQGPPQFTQSAPTCQHGIPAKYVQGGMSKTGRPYKAFWACAMDRNSQCGFRQDA